MSQGCSSLNAYRPGSENSWADVLPDRAAPDPSLQAELALSARVTEGMLATLPERERKVMKGFYGLGDQNPVTLKEVGGNLNLSAERIRQIRKQVIKRIRQDPWRSLCANAISAWSTSPSDGSDDAPEVALEPKQPPFFHP